MPQILVEVSARHCHVSQTHLDILFGAGYQLQKMKDLSQPGQYAAAESVTIRNEHGTLEKLRILGPARSSTQIELALTDARKLKLSPPVRMSGNTKGSPGVTMIGPKGQVVLNEGVIIAQRHIHLDPATAEKFSVKDGQIVKVHCEGDRSVTFCNTIVRVHKDFAPAMHIDTDEGNAALGDAKGPVQGEIIR